MVIVSSLSACGDKSSTESSKEEQKEDAKLITENPATEDSTTEKPTIEGYWERTAGGDYDPDIALIIAFLPDGHTEKICLYHENSANSDGYREKYNYYLDQDNILHMFGASWPINELTQEKLVFGGQTFKRVTKDAVLKRISMMTKWEEE